MSIHHVVSKKNPIARHNIYEAWCVYRRWYVHEDEELMRHRVTRGRWRWMKSHLSLASRGIFRGVETRSMQRAEFFAWCAALRINPWNTREDGDIPVKHIFLKRVNHERRTSMNNVIGDNFRHRAKLCNIPQNYYS